MNSPILLVLTSKTGNTKTFLNFLQNHLNKEIQVCEKFDVPVKDYNYIIFGTYTWGNGKIPKRMKDYLIANHKDLKGKEVFIFGSGNSIYPHFCRAVDNVEKICLDSGAIVRGKFKFEQRFNEKEVPQVELEELSNILSNFGRD